MSNYNVQLGSAPPGHEVPALLQELGAFVASQPHGSLGWFDGMEAEEVPTQWSEENADRLRRSAFAFLQLPDGSLIALMRAETGAPIVLLGSEGEARTVGESLEDFIVKWSKGRTEIDDLDDPEASSRKELAAWVKKKAIKAPRAAKRFDFQGWLDGDGPAAAAAAAAPARAETETMRQLGPKLREAVALVGLAADDPDVVHYVTTALKKKVIDQTTASNDGKWVEAKKAGLNLYFSHKVNHDAYPPRSKSKNAFIPYLEGVDVSEAIKEEVLGVPWKATKEDLMKILGTPTFRRQAFTTEDGKGMPVWVRPLDAARDIDLTIQFGNWLKISAGIRQAAELDSYRPTLSGLFVAWALERGLVDERRLAAHGALIADMKAHRRKGSDLIRALGRGLWDDHLVDRGGLRGTAYDWFHNMDGLSMTADLIAVFGERTNSHGHSEPVLDDDTWDAVDRAASALDRRFAPSIAP
jgi:hypothetical protein